MLSKEPKLKIPAVDVVKLKLEPDATKNGAPLEINKSKEPVEFFDVNLTFSSGLNSKYSKSV